MYRTQAGKCGAKERVVWSPLHSSSPPGLKAHPEAWGKRACAVVCTRPQLAARSRSAPQNVPQAGPCCRLHFAAAGRWHRACALELCGNRARVVVATLLDLDPPSANHSTPLLLRSVWIHRQPIAAQLCCSLEVQIKGRPSRSESYSSSGAHHRMGGILAPIHIQVCYQNLADTGYSASAFSTRRSFEN